MISGEVLVLLTSDWMPLVTVGEMIGDSVRDGSWLYNAFILRGVLDRPSMKEPLRDGVTCPTGVTRVTAGILLPGSTEHAACPCFGFMGTKHGTPPLGNVSGEIRNVVATDFGWIPVVLVGLVFVGCLLLGKSLGETVISNFTSLSASDRLGSSLALVAIALQS